MKVDWKNPDAQEHGMLGPGIYLAEVASSEETTSRSSGAAMFNIRLVAVEFPRGDEGKPAHLCYHNIMCEGAGLSMGLAQLRALGYSDGDEEINAETMRGRTAWVAVMLDTYNEQTRLKVDARAKGMKCGFLPGDAPAPDGAKRGPNTAERDEFASPPAPAKAATAKTKGAARSAQRSAAAEKAAADDDPVPF